MSDTFTAEGGNFDQMPSLLWLGGAVAPGVSIVWTAVRRYATMSLRKAICQREDLADDCGITVRALDDRLNAAVESGWMLITPRMGLDGQTSNHYHALWTPIDRPDDPRLLEHRRRVEKFNRQMDERQARNVETGRNTRNGTRSVRTATWNPEVVAKRLAATAEWRRRLEDKRAKRARLYGTDVDPLDAYWGDEAYPPPPPDPQDGGAKETSPPGGEENFAGGSAENFAPGEAENFAPGAQETSPKPNPREPHPQNQEPNQRAASGTRPADASSLPEGDHGVSATRPAAAAPPGPARVTVRVGDVDDQGDDGEVVDATLEPDDDGHLFGASPAACAPEAGDHAAAGPEGGPSPVQALVGAYAEAVAAGGGTLTSDHAAAVGRNVKRILTTDPGIPLPVVLRAVQQAASRGSREIGAVLAAPNGPGARYASSMAHREAMDEAWRKVAPDMDAWVAATMGRDTRRGKR